LSRNLVPNFIQPFLPCRDGRIVGQFVADVYHRIDKIPVDVKHFLGDGQQGDDARLRNKPTDGVVAITLLRRNLFHLLILETPIYYMFR